MTALKILLGILLLLFLIGRIRVGGDGEYSEDGLLVRVRVGAIHIQVFPLKRERKEKKPKKKRAEKAKDNAEEPEKPKKGGAMDLVRAALPLIGEAAGELKERIRIDQLRMDVLFGGTDAAQTAILYGMSNAVIGVLLGIFEQNFEVKQRQVRTGVDFNEKSITLWLKAAFSARIGQLVSFGLRYGWKFFVNYRNEKKTDTTKKEAT